MNENLKDIGIGLVFFGSIAVLIAGMAIFDAWIIVVFLVFGIAGIATAKIVGQIIREIWEEHRRTHPKAKHDS